MVTENSVTVHIDELLSAAGEYGRFQKLLTLLLIMINVPVSFSIMIMYFCSLNSPWMCTHGSEACNSTDVIFDRTDMRRCNINRSDWKYTEDEHFSLVTQFDLTCEQQWIVDLNRSIGFVGWAFGAVFFGWLGDKYGRKILLLPSFLSSLFITFITPFLPNIYLITVARMLSCVFVPGCTVQSLILLSEVVDTSHRAHVAILIYMSVPIAFCLLALKAYLIHAWKLLCMVCSLPYLVLIFGFDFIPESIHWLHVNGRHEEIITTIQRLAKYNENELSPNVKLSSAAHDEREHTSSVLDIFRSRKLAKFSACAGYIWLSTALGYFGLLLCADDLGGSEYLDFFLMSFMEIPTAFVAISLCDRFGRKRGTLIPTTLGGIMLLAVTPFPKTGTLVIPRIAFGMVGKFMLSITFYNISLWSVELYPVMLRSKALGWFHVTARAGSALAPWVSEWLSPFGKGAPFLFMGVPVFIGVLLGTMLPETKVVESDGDDIEGCSGGDVEMKTATSKI